MRSFAQRSRPARTPPVATGGTHARRTRIWHLHSQIPVNRTSGTNGHCSSVQDPVGIPRRGKHAVRQRAWQPARCMRQARCQSNQITYRPWPRRRLAAPDACHIRICTWDIWDLHQRLCAACPGVGVQVGPTGAARRVTDLGHADGIALCSSSPEGLQGVIDCFCACCTEHGLVVNASNPSKCAVMVFGAANAWA